MMKQIFLSFVLLVAAGAVAFAQDETKSYTKVGDAMPDFSVTETGGSQFKISDLKGKIIYVNFWATWCPPCQEEMPRIEKEIWQRNKSSKNFVMAAIAREQTEEEIAPFVKKYGYTFPVAGDPDREVFKLFGDSGIPRSYVVGADGKILFQTVGYNPQDFDRLVKIIADELKRNEAASR